MKRSRGKSPKKAPKRKTAAKPVSKASARGKATKAVAPKKGKSPASPQAAKMAAFSAKILQEEEAPVAVRSWSEAKAGSSGRKEYHPKTGEVTPKPTSTPAPRAPEIDEEEDDVDEEEADVELEKDSDGSEPRLEPLLGQAAVPKSKVEQFEFVKTPKAKKGKKPERPEEFGQVELRQATASGGRHLTRARPENLQRGASRIGPLASSEAAHHAKVEPDHFDVAQQSKSGNRRPGAPPAGPSAKDLFDFGEVEIDQQTRSGAKKVGKLKVEAHRKDEEE